LFQRIKAKSLFLLKQQSLFLEFDVSLKEKKKQKKTKKRKRKCLLPRRSQLQCAAWENDSLKESGGYSLHTQDGRIERDKFEVMKSPIF
jgi:hypothetical protein